MEENTMTKAVLITILKNIIMLLENMEKEEVITHIKEVIQEVKSSR